MDEENNEKNEYTVSVKWSNRNKARVWLAKYNMAYGFRINFDPNLKINNEDQEAYYIFKKKEDAVLFSMVFG